MAIFRGNLLPISLGGIYAAIVLVEAMVFWSFAAQLFTISNPAVGVLVLIGAATTGLPLVLLVLRWAKTRSFYPASFPASDPATAIAIGVVGAAGLSYCLIGIAREFMGYEGFPGEVMLGRVIIGFMLVWIAGLAHELFLKTRRVQTKSR